MRYGVTTSGECTSRIWERSAAVGGAVGVIAGDEILRADKTVRKDLPLRLMLLPAVVRSLYDLYGSTLVTVASNCSQVPHIIIYLLFSPLADTAMLIEIFR